MALDFTLSEEQIAIKQSARDIMKGFGPQREKLREKVMKRKEFPQEIWDAIARAGFFGGVVPEKYGGTGMGLLAFAFAMEEMGTLGFGNALMILTVMDALCILKNGPEDLRKRFLPKIAQGEYKCAFAITEPDAGSNTFRISTHAKKKDGVYLLNGQKTFITGVDVADYMLVVTRTKTVKELDAEGMPKVFGLSLFMVNTKSKGITLQTLPTRGIEGMNQYTIFFEDCEVPAENLVGEENQGSFAMFKALNPERILAAASAVGLSEYSIQKAIAYAQERKVFRNTPIGAYQAIQHPLAEAKIYQEAARLLCYKAAWAYDKDFNPGEVGQYTNMAKYVAVETAIMAVDRAIETLGGYGFSEDYGLIHLHEAVRLMRTAPITKEMILNFISEHTLGMPRSY